MRPVKNDIAGQRFDKLVALIPIFNKFGHAEWLCRCDCGAHYGASSSKLKNGEARSCGCAREFYGKSKTDEYGIWIGIIGRCENPEHESYPRYGGRGITICAEWRHSFETFITDMGERPSKQHSIDRIDNNLGYWKANCRWATQKEQMRNTRRNVFLTFNGETKCLADWSEATGISQATISARMRSGWSAAAVLTEPTRKRHKAA